LIQQIATSNEQRPAFFGATRLPVFFATAVDTEDVGDVAEAGCVGRLVVWARTRSICLAMRCFWRCDRDAACCASMTCREGERVSYFNGDTIPKMHLG
jgi:hypothetical protein